jgi:predicted amidohydrolase YtcJ
MKLKWADLVLLNGKVITFDSKDTRAEAVAVSGNKIIFVGPSEEAKKLVDESTEVLDLEGRVLLPGFIDSHTHFIQMGMTFGMIDLREANSMQQALQMVKERIQKTRKGELVVGVNWDESKWPENRYIMRRDLDGVTTDHMVALVRIDGHMVSVNSLLLKIAKIPKEKRGVEVDSHGEPTGVLKEEAAEYVRDSFPADQETLMKGLERATDYAHSLGVTSVNDTVSTSAISTYLFAHRQGKLRMRVYMNFVEEALDHLIKAGLSTGFGDDVLKLGALKLFSDGSIGSRTAALNGEFVDEKGNRGMLIYETGKLEEVVTKAHRAGIQVAVHAIGDRAIGITQGAIKNALKSEPRKDHRHRIEHMELVTDDEIRTLADTGIIASMQPNFIGEWGLPGDLYEKRLGKRWVQQNNPYRKILDKGGKIAFGSDCMPFGPLYGIHWAVNAPMESQRISVHQALRCYTIRSAYASFEEGIKGSIEAGKLADMVALSEDPYENAERIREIKISLTIQDGRIVYNAMAD